VAPPTPDAGPVDAAAAYVGTWSGSFDQTYDGSVAATAATVLLTFTEPSPGTLLLNFPLSFPGATTTTCNDGWTITAASNGVLIISGTYSCVLTGAFYTPANVLVTVASASGSINSSGQLVLTLTGTDLVQDGHHYAGNVTYVIGPLTKL
jgi:hypothetical protein